MCGAIIRYEWNAADRLQAVYLPGGGIRRFEYHPGLHLVSRRINPDGSVLTYRYGLNGHLSEKVAFGKQETELVTRYERDPMGAFAILAATRWQQAFVPLFSWELSGIRYTESTDKAMFRGNGSFSDFYIRRDDFGARAYENEKLDVLKDKIFCDFGCKWMFILYVYIFNLRLTQGNVFKLIG